MLTHEQILIDAELNTQENLALCAAHSNPRALAWALTALDDYMLVEDYRDILASSNEPKKMVNGLIELNKASLLTQERAALLAHHDKPRLLAMGLINLHQAKLLTEYAELLVTHVDPDELAQGLCLLHENHLSAYIPNLLKHAQPIELANAIINYKKIGILDENIGYLIAADDTEGLAQALLQLHRHHILEPYREIVSKAPSPLGLSEAFTRLVAYNPQVLSDYQTELLLSPRPIELANACIRLSQSQLLTHEYVQFLANYESPDKWALLFIALHGAGLLDPGHISAIQAVTQFDNFCRLIQLLHQGTLLNAENIDFIITHPFLYSNEAMTVFWGQVPEYLIQANWQAIVTAATDINPLEALVHLRNQLQEQAAFHGQIVLLPQVEENVPVAEINHAQSTHTSSVHRSVSESALALKGRYAQLDKAQTLGEIGRYINGLSDSPRHQAAKRAFSRLTHPLYGFVDSSGVSTSELLALFFHAIHDDEVRMGELQDALEHFIDALYEIQRGYNIERNDPEEAPDSQICQAGTFNKLIEKMVGVHPDASIVFITGQTAGLRLEQVGRLEAFRYLQRLATPRNLVELQHFFALLQGIQENGIDYIFEEISEQISTHFFPDYQPLYPEGGRDPRFVAMLQVARDLELSPAQYDALKVQVMQSSAYQQLCSVSLQPLSINSLWARRHDHPEAQHAFDMQYGLVPKA